MTISSASISTGSRFGVITTSDLAKYAMIFFMAAQAFMPFGVVITFAILSFIIWLALSQWCVNRRLFVLLLPLSLLMATGVLFARQNSLFDAAKDVFYVGKTMVGLGLGYVLARHLRDFRTLCRIIVMAAVLASIAYIAEVVIRMGEGVSIFQLRSEEVRANFISVVGLAVLLKFRKAKSYIASNGTYYYLAFAGCLTSLLLSFSRTFILLFIVNILVLQGWDKIKTKNIFRISIVASIFLLVLFVATSGGDEGGGRGIASKFMSSLSEIAFENYTEMRDINLHWRGFESYRALVDFQAGSIGQKLFGQGLGSTVDLGFYMNLGGGTFRYIPILHNGYMYVLVKFGLVGLIIVLYWLFRTVQYGSSRNTVGVSSDELLVRRLLAALGWSFLLSTFVVAGIVNVSMFPLHVLWGGLVAWIDLRRSF